MSLLYFSWFPGSTKQLFSNVHGFKRKKGFKKGGGPLKIHRAMQKIKILPPICCTEIILKDSSHIQVLLSKNSLWIIEEILMF